MTALAYAVGVLLLHSGARLVDRLFVGPRPRRLAGDWYREVWEGAGIG